MGGNIGGMLWLTRPEDMVESRLGGAVGYAEQKYGRPVRAILHPVGESYPHVWNGIHLEPSRYVLAHHLYLVLDEVASAKAADSESGREPS